MSAHIEGVDCPERETRTSMTDEAFWERVSESVDVPCYWGAPDLDQTTYQNDPCPECGEHGACAIDAEGRVLMHITTNGDDE